MLGRYGGLTDAAVFPARIGPLGYAFVKFERLEDAVRAFESLNNTVVPPLSGSKQLKMRYKPAHDGPVGREDPSDPGKGAPGCWARRQHGAGHSPACCGARVRCPPRSRHTTRPSNTSPAPPAPPWCSPDGAVAPPVAGQHHAEAER